MTPSEPTNARSRRTRRRLLAAARELLERDGFDALTMTAVADDAGVTRRTVYLHFASRSELVAALFDFVSEAEGLGASVEQVWAAPDGVTALREWARHIARFHPRALAVTRAVEQVHRRDPDAATHRERYLGEQLAACRRLVGWLREDEALSPRWTVDDAADMLWSLISADMLERLLAERHWTPEHLADRLGVLLEETFVAR